MRRLSDYDRDCVPLGWRKSSSALDAGRTSSRGTIPRRSSSCHQPANRSPALRDGISTRRTPPGYSRSHRQHRPMGWLVDLPEPHRQRNRREPRVRRARVPWRRSGRGRRMRGAGRRVRLRSGAPRRGVVPGRGADGAFVAEPDLHAGVRGEEAGQGRRDVDPGDALLSSLPTARDPRNSPWTAAAASSAAGHARHGHRSQPAAALGVGPREGRARSRR